MNSLFPHLATYVHHLDPVIFDIPPIDILGVHIHLALRWYGLAYVAGFVLGYLVLLRLSRRRLYCIAPEKLGDFITWVCMLGVLGGARLGEFFFYWLPKAGWSGFCADPLWVFRVWEGGMASHGGIIAVLLVAMVYARRNGLSIAAVCDGLAIVCPIGLFFGRVANFINGELYGRVADAANPIAMKFPQEILELPPVLPPAQLRECFKSAQNAYGGDIVSLQQCVDLCRTNEAVRNAMEPFLTPRYPSQLFEAAGEGLLIFLVLFLLRLRWKSAPAGTFSCLFCFLYAAARITTECYREPETANLFGVITRGQYLSFGVILLGVVFFFIARRHAKLQKIQKI